jgi:hypothetical protein
VTARSSGSARRSVGDSPAGLPGLGGGPNRGTRVASRIGEDVSAAGGETGRRAEEGVRAVSAGGRGGDAPRATGADGADRPAAAAGAPDRLARRAAASGTGRTDRFGLGTGELLLASAGYSERADVGVAGDDLSAESVGPVVRRTADGGAGSDATTAAPAGERRVAVAPSRTEATRPADAKVDANVDARETESTQKRTNADDVAVGPTRPEVARTPGIELIGKRGGGSLAFAQARYSGGDWDCDKTAMPNLAYQMERRVGILLSTEARTVDITSDALRKQPFIFISGHKAIRFTEAERQALRKYIAGGGSVWINDSTHEHDNTFDRAVRVELARLLPDRKLVKLPMEHALFRSCYDLSGGFKGYRVPPGDKYRCDYLEGIQVDGRTAVVYTRNDYGDGLEIDPRTAPLMQSLTDLSPQDMQEGSVRMGINIALYFMRARLGPANTKQIARTIRENTHRADRDHQAAIARALVADLDGFDTELAWQPEADWGDPAKVASVSRPVRGQKNWAMSIDVPMGQKRLAAVSRDLFEQVDLSKRDALVMDVTSRMPAGCRVAVGVITMPDWQYFESPPAYIRPGANPNVVFRLDQPNFKCEASGWKFNRRVANLSAVRKLVLIIQPLRAGKLEIDSLRVATFQDKPDAR